jgi:hypothetical protein
MTTSITKPFLRDLRIDIDNALAAVATKHGISLTAGNATFTENTATIKLNAALLVGGRVATKEQENLKLYQGLLKISDEQMTQEFTLGSKRFVLDGYKNSGRTTKPFVIREVGSDRLYVASEDQINRALGITK